MLIITRRAGEKIMLGDDVTVEIIEVSGSQRSSHRRHLLPEHRRRALADDAAGRSFARSRASSAATASVMLRVPRPAVENSRMD